MKASVAAGSSTVHGSSRSLGAPPVQPMQRQLEGMPAQELESLLTDDDQLQRFAAAWVAAGEASEALSELRTQNLGLARDNMAMQDRIAEARNQVAIVKSTEYAAVKGVFKELAARQSAVLSALRPDVLLDGLRQEVGKDELVSGTLSVDSFVPQYLALRCRYHNLDLKRQVAEHSMM